MKSENKKKDEKIVSKHTKNAKRKTGCPVCGNTENLRVTGRCVTCISCGWSRCSI